MQRLNIALFHRKQLIFHKRNNWFPGLMSSLFAHERVTLINIKVVKRNSMFILSGTLKSIVDEVQSVF